MRYLIWLLRAVVFFLLLGFAVKNDQPVELHYFLGYEWRASLVVILLMFFVIGVCAGMLALLGNLLQQRKEIAALRRELRLKNQLADVEKTQHLPVQPS
ncbi:MAG: LapA family protein [Nitrosomonadales bacterium]|nr:LapA family protein [Nitrosomonadales bacterium]